MALVKTFRMMYNLTGFSEVRILPFCLGNDIIMTLFLVAWFSKFEYFVKPKIGYQAAKLQCCRISRSSFTSGLEKQNDDVTITQYHIFGIRNFHIL